jgi:hypothetical protein
MADERKPPPTRNLNLSEVEEALLSSVQTIFEIILSADISRPATIEKLLVPTRDRYWLAKKRDAAAVVEILRAFVTDPKREKIRAQRRKLLGDGPTGSA